MTSPSEDAINAFASPRSGTEVSWNVGDRAATAVRVENQKDEAYLKAMGMINYVYALWFGSSFMFCLGYTICHLQGTILAPWSVEGRWVLAVVSYPVLTVLAVLAGFGFRRRRRWALRVEAILALWWLTLGFAIIFVAARPVPLLEMMVTTLFVLALCVPMMNLWDLGHSPVFDPQYESILAATAPIRIHARLPIELKIISGFLLACAVAGCYYQLSLRIS
jgi:hypothetical protein